VNPTLRYRRRSNRRDSLDAARASEQWKKDNLAAIAAHNDFMTKHGVFSDGLRRF
jgi:post-segregation antitoxin (ccd killing protein)